MGQAIGDLLPAAVGVAISPLPIVAVVLMLVSDRGRRNGPAFVTGWIVGVAGAGTILLLVAGGLDANEGGPPAGWVSWLELLIGLGLVLLAVNQWRSRPRGDEVAPTPTWMGALDGFGPVKAAAAGVVLSALNPKNLLLIAAGMAAIAQTGIPAGEQAIALAVFTIVAASSVAAPVVVYFVLGERSVELLDRLKTWMAQNNAVVMAVLLLVLGVKLIGDAIPGLA